MSGLRNEKEPSLQYDMKLLAVDIPMESGPDQRLFLVGDEQEYKVGGALISSLSEVHIYSFLIGQTNTKQIEPGNLVPLNVVSCIGRGVLIAPFRIILFCLNCSFGNQNFPMPANIKVVAIGSLPLMLLISRSLQDN